jgi:UDP-glucose 4-epimerase
MSGDFMNAHPDRYVAIVRSCVVIGPEGSGSVGTGMFRPLMMMRLLGYDPALQFVHEDDLVELMLTLLRQKQRGIFNCAGPGFLRYKEVIAATGKPSIVFPAGIMSPLLAISWWLHLQSESPPGGLEFIKYPIVLSTEKVQKATGFQFRYSSREALLSFLNARKLVRWLHYTNEAEG